MSKTLRLILGDQLNAQHSWFESKSNNTLYVMMEILPETNYVKHHIQKVVAFFLAMRSFSENRREEGHQIKYFQLDDEDNQQCFGRNLSALIQSEKIERFEYLLPDEYRLDKQLREFSKSLSIPSEAIDTEHFLTKRTELTNFFKGKKTYLLESFYRDMRRQYDIMMEDNEPLTGKWNYDAENRNKYDPKVPIPSPPLFEREVTDIVQALDKLKVKTIGRIQAKKFTWAVTREEALKTLDFFVEKCLVHFGTFQDSMHKDEPFLFHSRLSFALNAKILHPLEVVRKAISHWQAHQDKIDIAQVEGFVRQIIGWREYMRGVYWAKMPEYATKNYFGHTQKLPEFYWTGETKMNCLSQAINQSLDNAYAHHIQRLMITGNFALLAGIDPDEVDAWYLGIYIDAIEWVEITNTRGMSQFADGGIVGTKPYTSSANYIDKMSNYCKNCFYDKKEKTTENACPFNSLYWNFYDRHRDKLSKNARIGMAYRNLDRMKPDDKANLLEKAKQYLENLDKL